MILHLIFFFTLFSTICTKTLKEIDDEFAYGRTVEFNQLIKSMNNTLIRHHFTNPYTIHWCDYNKEPQTTVIPIDDDFRYPYGSERFFGLGLVAVNPVFHDKTFRYDNYGFNLNTTFEMIKVDGDPWWKYKSETRRMCHNALYDD